MINQPLDWRVPIVDSNGRPSPEFQRRLNAQNSVFGSFGHIYNLWLGASGGSPNFSISAGEATDSSNAMLLQFSQSWTKVATSIWAAGNGNGALDTGTFLANTWYYFYLIGKLDGKDTDILISTSSTTPTMPASYTLSRRIGAMISDASAVGFLGFIQRNSRFVLLNPFGILNGTVIGTSASLRGVLAPPNLTTEAFGNSVIIDPGVNSVILISSPLVADNAPGAIPGNFTIASGGTSTGIGAGPWSVFTNTSQQIRVRASSSTAALYLVSYGWIDTRDAG